MKNTQFSNCTVANLITMIENGSVSFDDLPRKAKRKVVMSLHDEKQKKEPYQPSKDRRAQEEGGAKTPKWVAVSKIEDTNGAWFGPKYDLNADQLNNVVGLEQGCWLEINGRRYLKATWVDVVVYELR